jgi:hypothetical protein
MCRMCMTVKLGSQEVCHLRQESWGFWQRHCLRARQKQEYGKVAGSVARSFTLKAQDASLL